MLRTYLLLQWQSRTAEARWRRGVDEMRATQGVLDRYRHRVTRVCSQTYLRARTRLWELAGPGGELEQARDAVYAVYRGQPPLSVVNRLEDYVRERFPETVPAPLRPEAG